MFPLLIRETYYFFTVIAYIAICVRFSLWILHSLQILVIFSTFSANRGSHGEWGQSLWLEVTADIVYFSTIIANGVS